MTISQPSVSVGRRAAVAAAILYLAVSLLIQVEDFALFLHVPADGWRSALVFAAALPFRQFEHILFTAGLSALAIPMCRWRPGRVAYVAVFGLLLLYVVLDQAAFLTFFGHFEWVTADGSVNLEEARDSLIAEIPFTLAPNLLVWAGSIVVMVRTVWNAAAQGDAAAVAQARAGQRTGAIAALAVLFMAISAVVLWTTPASPLDREAIFVLARSIFPGALAPDASLAADPDLYRLRFGKTADDGSDASALNGLFHEIRQAAPKPNIVLVIMESVGSEQLFTGQGLSPRVTPTLAGLSDHMVSFEALYNTFPATMRGHLPINTGGRTITLSNFSGPVVDRYQGPVLVRELKKTGYRTALVSAELLGLENIETFYRSLAYDYLYQPGMETAAFLASREVHSWGVDEDLARQRALEWIDRSDASGPFFLQLDTVSTHHPYSGPKWYRGPLTGTDAQTQYYNALSYVDRVLGTLISDLRQRGLLDNTLIFICGDHGQAFGDIHKSNYYHQAFLYEENIRNFLAVLAPGAVGHGLRLSRVGSVGDIMPTIVSLAGGDPGDVRGQNLFDPDYEDRLVFFHKAVAPRQWGLRDGPWKFTSTMTSTQGAELYDLRTDSAEQRNVAAQYPLRIEAYQRACRQWYLETDHDYTTRVAANPPPDTPRRLASEGPEPRSRAIDALR